MNLEDVLDPEYGLQQDEWSLSKPAFGDEGQLQVVGWSGKNGSGNKYYILKCNKCSEDSELFDEGVFSSLKGTLIKGSVPCGCSKIPKWSKEQYQILCSRKATELGYTFLGFVGEWKGQNTKIEMLCEKHGEWSSGNINNLTNNGRGCPECGVETVGKAKTKPDEVIITSFFNSGAFHPQTKFWRSDRLGMDGYKRHWFMSCGECGGIAETESGSLQAGKRSCACGKEASRLATIKANMKPDDVMIASFFNSGKFHHKVKFWRSDRLNSYGHKTYWFMFCPECGETSEATSGGFQKGCRPCACGREAHRLAALKASTKSDELMIASFLASDSFHPETKFWRSDRLCGRGRKPYWFIHCPVCGETGESLAGKLQLGQRSCACNNQRQQECYINWIVDGGNKVALKFGIARDSKQRIKSQNRQAVYEVRQFQVYKFPDVSSCKKAERECKKELECGILLKRDMPDGYSETTWIYNLSKIQDIYKRNGGELV